MAVINSSISINSWISALVVGTLFLAALALSSHRRLSAALCCAGLLTALTKLTVGVHSHTRVTRFDDATMSWFAGHQSQELDWAARVITDLGSPGATAAAGLLCGAVLAWEARSVIRGIVVVGTVGAATLAETALKAVIVRPLTPAELQWGIGNDTFPSGHVTGTGALLGIIAVCVGVGRSRTDRAWLTGCVVAGVLAVAFARLYLGVHWLTDVIGGAILAGVFVSLGAVVMPLAPNPARTADTRLPTG